MKKRLIFILTLLSCLFLIGVACGERFYIISVKNNSDINIIVCGDYILPDTLLPATPLRYVVVKPKSFGKLEDNVIGDTELKRIENEKLSIFIIDKQIFENTPWDTIRKYNKILKRYELNLAEYRQMGSLVTYP